jgi:predicted nucleotidyltransferase
MVYGDHELISRITRYLAFVGGHLRVERAFLYGSYAYGVPRSRSDIDLVVLSPDFAPIDRRRRQEQLAIWAWQAGVGDIEALGLTPEEFGATSDLSLLGEVREKGVVVYDAAHPERTPAMALRERRAEYGSGKRLDSNLDSTENH